MTEKILAILFIFISKVIAVTGYAGIAILMAIESACIPLPSELIMPFGGYLVFQGTFKLFWLATAGAIGCNLGSLVAYEIGCYGGRPLLLSLGISRRFHCSSVAGRSHLYRVACRHCAHAPRTLPPLHFSGIVALVSRSGLPRDEAWRKLARARKVFPQVRRGNRRDARSRHRIFRLESLAESHEQPAVSNQPKRIRI